MQQSLTDRLLTAVKAALVAAGRSSMEAEAFAAIIRPEVQAVVADEMRQLAAMARGALVELGGGYPNTCRVLLGDIVKRAERNGA